MKEKSGILKNRIESVLEKFRVKYYYEFALAVFSFGLTCIYVFYVYCRFPVFIVHSDTTMAYNMRLAVQDFDLAGVFFALNPMFDVVSSILLFGGCLWVVAKLFSHSLIKLSELELLPLKERIRKIEEEGEANNEQTISHSHNTSL